METILGVVVYVVAVYAVYRLLARRTTASQGDENAAMNSRARYRAAALSLLLCTVVAGAVVAIVRSQRESLLPEDVRAKIVNSYTQSGKYRNPRIEVVGRGKLYKSDVCYRVMLERQNKQTGAWEWGTVRGIASQLDEDWWETNVFMPGLIDDWQVLCP